LPDIQICKIPAYILEKDAKFCVNRIAKQVKISPIFLIDLTLFRIFYTSFSNSCGLWI